MLNILTPLMMVTSNWLLQNLLQQELQVKPVEDNLKNHSLFLPQMRMGKVSDLAIPFLKKKTLIVLAGYG